MSLLNNSNAIPTTGGDYNLENSLRFRSSASAYLSRTPTVAGNRKTFTISLWMKGDLISSPALFQARAASPTGQPHFVLMSTNGSLYILDQNAGTQAQIITTAVLRDPAAWYHVVVAIDTTEATAADRAKIYVNGDKLESFSTLNTFPLNYDTAVNNTVRHLVGARMPNASTALLQYLDNYLTEVNFVDGQALTPSDFGEYNEDTGVWQPIEYTGTYGTNGFYLKGRGTDNSGNGNNWTENNFNTTNSALTTYDIMTDVPTLTDEDTSNYAVINPLTSLSGRTSLSAANLQALGTSGVESGVDYGTIGVTSGKWYWENTVIAASGSYPNFGAVRVLYNPSNGKYVGSSETGGTGIFTNGGVYKEGSLLTTVTTYTTSDIIGIALDLDSLTCAIYKNNTLLYTTTGLTAGTYWAGIASYNSSSAAINFGQRPFAYTPPTGYKKLNTFNLPDSSIVDGSEYFNTVTYTGNGVSGRQITGVEFSPDFVWGKVRSQAYNNWLYDTVRGATLGLKSNVSSAEVTTPVNGYVSSFDADGFTATSGSSDVNNLNQSGQTYVAWNWKAGGAPTTTNTAGVGAIPTAGSVKIDGVNSGSALDGSIAATSISANTTAGFSVVAYTGNSTAGATIGHGLGTVPAMLIIKNRGQTNNWSVYHQANTASPQTQLIKLDETAATTSSSLPFNNTAPTSSVFSVSNWDGVNDSSYNYIAYCFADVEGYSKFGSYTGNGSTNGPFVYTGFKPAFIMFRSTSLCNWVIVDSTRSTYNVMDDSLYPNTSGSEITTITDVDFLSNGFKWRANLPNETNASGQTYIYMAFAENPFKNSLAR